MGHASRIIAGSHDRGSILTEQAENGANMRYETRFVITSLAVGLLLTGFAGTLRAEEPSYEQAVARWPDLTRPITFLGCKDQARFRLRVSEFRPCS